MDRTQVPADSLILYGEKDGRHTREYFELARCLFLGHESREMILDAGHYPHLERPDEVNKQAIDFLRLCQDC